jgi:hypothetical protein
VPVHKKPWENQVVKIVSPFCTSTSPKRLQNDISDHRLIPVSVFFVKIADSEHLKKDSGRTFNIRTRSQRSKQKISFGFSTQKDIKKLCKPSTLIQTKMFDFYEAHSIKKYASRKRIHLKSPLLVTVTIYVFHHPLQLTKQNCLLHLLSLNHSSLGV